MAIAFQEADQGKQFIVDLGTQQKHPISVREKNIGRMRFTNNQSRTRRGSTSKFYFVRQYGRLDCFRSLSPIDQKEVDICKILLDLLTICQSLQEEAHRAMNQVC